MLNSYVGREGQQIVLSIDMTSIACLNDIYLYIRKIYYSITLSMKKEQRTVMYNKQPSVLDLVSRSCCTKRISEINWLLCSPEYIIIVIKLGILEIIILDLHDCD